MGTVRLTFFKYFIYALYMREHGAIVDTNVFWVLNFFPSSTDVIGLLVPTRKLTDFTLLHVSLSSNTVPPLGEPFWQI
jgi:hypothetical protein